MEKERTIRSKEIAAQEKFLKAKFELESNEMELSAGINCPCVVRDGLPSSSNWAGQHRTEEI